MSRKMMGALTLSISNSIHTYSSPIFWYKSCSVATHKHSEPFSLDNYVRIVAVAPNLRKVSVYSTTAFFYHSSTIELLSLLILIKVSYPSLRLTTMLGNHHQPCGCCDMQIHARLPRRSVPQVKATNDFSYETTPHIP